MLEVLAANELLEQAEELFRCGQYSALLHLLESAPDETFQDDRQLAWLLARAHIELGHHSRALAIMVGLRKHIIPNAEDRPYRRCLNLCGTLHVFFGELDRAEITFLEVVDLCLASNDQGVLAEATLNLGVIADIRTNWNQAIAAYQRALIPLQNLGARIAIAHCYHNLGMALRQIGRYAQSLANFDVALEYYKQFASEYLVLACESERALLVFRMGDVQRAEASARRALARAGELGHLYTEGELLRTLGIILVGRHPAEARKCFERSLSAARNVGARMLEAEINEEIAVLNAMGGCWEGDVDHCLTEAIRLFREIGSTSRAELARQRVQFVDGIG